MNRSNKKLYCLKGTIFLKYGDASNALKTAHMLYKLFREVDLFVGLENVSLIVTRNAVNYVASGKLLENNFSTLFWFPCVTRCINLALQDMGKLEEVIEEVLQLLMLSNIFISIVMHRI